MTVEMGGDLVIFLVGMRINRWWKIHRWSNGDAGIWDETNNVPAGGYECVFSNMPRRGLGKVGQRVPASGKREFAAGRISRT